MGRSEDRKRKKSVMKKLNNNQFEQLMEGVNYEFIQKEVSGRLSILQDYLFQSMIEALKKNGINNHKCRDILDDTKSDFIRRIENEQKA